MRMFNLDGSEGMMCGNGIRCFAKFCYDHHFLYSVSGTRQDIYLHIFVQSPHYYR